MKWNSQVPHIFYISEAIQIDSHWIYRFAKSAVGFAVCVFLVIFHFAISSRHWNEWLYDANKSYRRFSPSVRIDLAMKISFQHSNFKAKQHMDGRKVIKTKQQQPARLTASATLAASFLYWIAVDMQISNVVMKLFFVF